MADHPDETERLRSALNEAEQQAERDRATIEMLRKESQEHHRETMRHVRNTLGVVHSIVCRTIADGETAETYQARLTSRLASFARLQSHLFRNPAAGVDLTSLVAEELLAFGIRLGTDAVVEGDTISLKPKAASTLGGAFHELARMAIEGGGFADANSRIAVYWAIEADEVAGSYLRIAWNESGRGIAPLPGIENEFARDVEGAVAYDLSGTVLLKSASDGLNCRFRLPMKWVVGLSTVPGT